MMMMVASADGHHQHRVEAILSMAGVANHQHQEEEEEGQSYFQMVAVLLVVELPLQVEEAVVEEERRTWSS